MKAAKEKRRLNEQKAAADARKAKYRSITEKVIRERSAGKKKASFRRFTKIGDDLEGFLADNGLDDYVPACR